MDEKKLNEQVDAAVVYLTDEQKKKVEDCKNMNDLIDLLGEMGVVLPDELMNAVAGGVIYQGEPGYSVLTTRCERCGHDFTYLDMWMPGWNCYKPIAPRYCTKCMQR